MRIGLDAKWYFSGPPSGRLVTRNLVDNLLSLDQENEIFIFLKSSDRDKEFVTSNKKVRLVYVYGGNNMIANLFAIPFHCIKQRISVVVFQNFGSFFPCGKKICFIHDAIFKSHPQFFTPKERIYFAPMLFLAGFSHRICTVSHSEKNRITRYSNFDSSKIDVIANGVHPRFQPRKLFAPEHLRSVRAEYQLPERYILYVGRLNDRKNLVSLLRSIPLLESRLPLVIVGSQDWKMSALDQEIRDLQIEDRVMLTGFVPDDNLPAIYALSSVFCFVSLEEGFGLPALEAMASGVPVVVSDIEVMREVCGDAGNYVLPRSPTEIARAIDEIASEGMESRQKVASGLRRASSFTWQNSVQHLRESISSSLQS